MTDKIKIQYFTYSDVPSKGADSIHIFKMCNALAQNGHDVELVYAKSYLQDLPREEPWTYYGLKPSFKIKQISLAPKFIDKILTHDHKYLKYIYLAYRKLVFPLVLGLHSIKSKPDLVFSRYIPGAYWASFFVKKLVVESHDPFEELKPFSAQLLKRIFKKQNFEKLVVITLPLYKNYIQKFPGLATKLMVAADGADKTGQIEPVVLQGEYDFNLGYTGHLFPGRGVEMIVFLAKKMPDLGFHIVGGHDEDIEYWLSKTKELSNLFFYGFVAPGKVSSYLSKFDLLLAPYQQKVYVGSGKNTVSRMSPLKIFEYMASGKAMICSDLAVLHEILENGNNAILCQADNCQEWQTAINQLKDNPLLAQKIGENAQNELNRNYTWKSRAAKIIDFK